MFRQLLATLLMLHAGAALAADGLGQLHHFKDWVPCKLFEAGGLSIELWRTQVR
jgi:hypothetical protein